MKAFLRMSSALAGALFFVVSSATAAPILITHDFAGGPPPPNDCAGEFGGQGGVPCDVGYALSAEVSPIIYKAGFNDGVAGETQTFGFPSIDGSEFAVNFDSGSSGTWSYTQGLDDPAVRFWVAKGGNEGFTLHWMVNEADAGLCAGDAYNLACLNAALSVTGGSWSVPGGFNLSHFSWYDTSDVPNVPEPVTLALFGTGLVGVSIAARRRRAR
jgi:hypothetical protein